MKRWICLVFLFLALTGNARAAGLVVAMAKAYRAAATSTGVPKNTEH